MLRRSELTEGPDPKKKDDQKKQDEIVLSTKKKWRRVQLPRNAYGTHQLEKEDCRLQGGGYQQLKR